MFVSADPSDNPMQSEIASHIGGAGNLFCRKCDAGGTNEEKESSDGFERLFKVFLHEIPIQQNLFPLHSLGARDQRIRFSNHYNSKLP